MRKPTLAADVNYTEQVPRFDELPTGPLHASRLAAGPAFWQFAGRHQICFLQRCPQPLGKGSSWKEEHGTR
jgi:hypothetical protein